jgi:hypothetical protein
MADTDARTPLPRDGSSAEVASPDPAEVNLEEEGLNEEGEGRPGISARRRAAQVCAVLAVVLLVVGLLLHSIGPAHPGTTSVSATATPVPPTVVIASNVNFGTLTVNGHALKGPPPVVTRLFHDGENAVTLSAPPFQPQTCSMWWVGGQVTSGAGTCFFGTGSTYRIAGALVTPDFDVTLPVDGSDLPPDLLASAARVVAQALGTVQLRTTVPAGQYYATGLDQQGHIASRRAATALAATVLFSLPAHGTSSVCGTAELCGVALPPGLPVPAGQRIWSVRSDLTVTWRYQAPSGSVMGVTVAPGLPSEGPGPFFQVFLAYTADTTGASEGSWSVVTAPAPTAVQGAVTPSLPDQLAQMLCEVGTELVGWLAQTHGTGGYGISALQDRGVEGCAIQLSQGASTAAQGTFLWRFGVLLAVDQGAHTRAPWLPMAPPAEVAAVEEAD